MSIIHCKTHSDIKLDDSDCPRCDGEGFTDSDVEAMDDPLDWHSDGACYSCKGSGVWKNSYCWKCENDSDIDEDSN